MTMKLWVDDTRPCPDRFEYFWATTVNQAKQIIIKTAAESFSAVGVYEVRK